MVKFLTDNRFSDKPLSMAPWPISFWREQELSKAPWVGRFRLPWQEMPRSEYPATPRPSLKFRPENISNWIYVTGIGRSGTTFVGKILSLPLCVDYIHEPFNPECGLPGIKRWDTYIRPSLETPEEQDLHGQIQTIFSYDFTLRTLVPQQNGPLRQWVKQRIGSRGPVNLRLAKLNPFHTAAIIKAPIGLFLTEYMYAQFGVKPVILVKHPVSVIASLQRAGWYPKPSQALDQPHLVVDYFSDEPEFVSQGWDDPILAIAAYWRVAHKVLLYQVTRHPSWLVISHEDLSAEPVATFRTLYDKLDLPWSWWIERHIRALTERPTRNRGNPQVHQFARSSKDIFAARLHSVPKETRRKIFDIVGDVASPLYPRESFAID